MQELSFKTLLGVLLNNLKWILIVGIIVAVAAGGYSEFFVKESYASSISMYVMNLTTTENGTANSTSISSSGLTASQLLVNECISLLKSDTILDEVCADLHEQGYDLNNSEIRSTLSMSSKDGTALLEIKSTTKNDKVLCRLICDSLMKVAPARINEIMLNLGTIRPVDEASDGRLVSSGSLRSAAIGGVIGCMLAYILALLLYLLDNTVKDEQDLRMRLGVTVLGAVPDLHPGQPTKKGGNYYG